MSKKIKVAVALSGGVDSAVSAALLKEQGCEVTCVFMKNWSGEWGTCRPDKERKDALSIALHLEIPFHVFDFEKQYREEVIEYFFDSYARGLTPNPDVVCNHKIKFGWFLQRAVEDLGVDLIATGHYARVVWSDVAASGPPRSPQGDPCANYILRSDPSRLAPADRSAADLGVYHLLKGSDKNKDQSYFLWTLGQKELSRTLFPVGEMTKDQVRYKAAELGLPVAKKPDSQGICFVGEVDLREFLRSRLGERPGKIVDVEGRVLGEHSGAHFYTVGQRHGLGIGGLPAGRQGGIPYYVMRTDTVKNEVVAAPLNHPAHFSKEMVVSDVSWVSGQKPKFPLKVGVKIRYRQPDVGAEVVGNASGPPRSPQGDPCANYILRSDPSRFAPADRSALLLVKFAEPQRAVTPGQSAVFYQGEELLGGGVIERDEGRLKPYSR